MTLCFLYPSKNCWFLWTLQRGATLPNFFFIFLREMLGNSIERHLLVHGNFYFGLYW
jgi:hypothetical protein